jgi:hypothetical protein
MKIRDGFVSNSSSGSFIFPEGMTVDDVWRVLEKTEVFLTDLEGKDVSCGLENIRVFDSTYEGRYWNFEDQLWITVAHGLFMRFLLMLLKLNIFTMGVNVC